MSKLNSRTGQAPVYWNNFEAVLEGMNTRISGKRFQFWHGHVIETYGLQERALVLGCGNGWVERDLFGKGFLRQVIGVDASGPALAQAQELAGAIGMAAEYRLTELDGFVAEGVRAEVAISVGAMQRVRFVNRVLEAVAAVVEGGLYVGFDYTGPHRHQYSWPIWSGALELNQTLPERFRVTLKYPDLSATVVDDPLDAVHSELLMDVLTRHFDLLERQPLGGGLAYLLLMNNYNLLDEQFQPEGRAVIDRVLTADAALARTVPEANLFTFTVARPKRVAAPAYQRTAWQADEDEREFQAAANGQRYYPPTPLEMIYSGIGTEPAPR